MEQYNAKNGDTWDIIAYKLYGDEFKSSAIIEVNPRLAHIIVFKGGEKINLPDMTETSAPNTLAPWRR
jgi:phage tail protein X